MQLPRPEGNWYRRANEMEAYGHVIYPHPPPPVGRRQLSSFCAKHGKNPGAGTQFAYTGHRHQLWHSSSTSRSRRYSSTVWRNRKPELGDAQKRGAHDRRHPLPHKHTNIQLCNHGPCCSSRLWHMLEKGIEAVQGRCCF